MEISNCHFPTALSMNVKYSRIFVCACVCSNSAIILQKTLLKRPQCNTWKICIFSHSWIRFSYRKWAHKLAGTLEIPLETESKTCKMTPVPTHTNDDGFHLCVCGTVSVLHPFGLQSNASGRSWFFQMSRVCIYYRLMIYAAHGSLAQA